jgi:hypothetical protein
MELAIIRNLREKTGRTLEQWVKVAQAAGIADFKRRVGWLKTKHKLGHVQAGIVAMRAEGEASEYLDGDAVLEKLFAGEKAALRPIFDRLADAARKLGPDIRFTPNKTYMSVARERQFAVIKPGRRRVELGLALGKQAASGRLEDEPPRGASERITHRIVLATAKEVDAEVRRWLKEAYAVGG